MFLYDEPPSECYQCEQRDERLKDVKYWFHAICGQLFGVDEFDAEELQRYSQELASYLEMKIPLEPLAVDRKNRTTEMLEDWKQFNNQYLNHLAKTGS